MYPTVFVSCRVSHVVQSQLILYRLESLAVKLSQVHQHQLIVRLEAEQHLVVVFAHGFHVW